MWNKIRIIFGVWLVYLVVTADPKDSGEPESTPKQYETEEPKDQYIQPTKQYPETDSAELYDKNNTDYDQSLENEDNDLNGYHND